MEPDSGAERQDVVGKFTKAVSQQKFLKMALYGAAGSGKTLTSLLFAEGLAAISKKRIAYVDKGLEYPLNLITGWLAADRLESLEPGSQSTAEVLRLVRQVNRCLEAAPRLWQRSIMEDRYSTDWYKAGGRPMIIGQWVSHCQNASLTAVADLAASGATTDQAYSDLLAELKGTDVETILRVHRGELDGEPNLLNNGSFESTEGTEGEKPSGPGWTSEGTPPGWGTWKIDAGKGRLYLDAGKAHSGTLSAALEGGDCTCYIATVPVEAKKHYVAWAYAWAEKASSDRKTTLEVRWQDEKGKWFNGGLNTSVETRHPGRWERLVSPVAAPEGAARAVVLLVVYDMPEGERAWFDDAAFVAVP